MRKRRVAAAAAYEAQWDGGRGSHHQVTKLAAFESVQPHVEVFAAFWHVMWQFDWPQHADGRTARIKSTHVLTGFCTNLFGHRTMTRRPREKE